jgi:PIN domain nuclease of toxin-antitoxin system
VRVLLDTHVLLWVMADDPALPAAARSRLERADAVYVSSASIWEVAIKAALGKLDVDIDTLVARLPAAGLEQLPVTWEHARLTRHLPPIHRDPFDRMLVAQAVCEPLHLFTADKALAGYSELVVVV